MPRAFSEDERETIRRELVQVGRKLLAKQGIRRTKVSELTREVGIAPGSFYAFFESKEALFLEVIEEEEILIRRSIVEKYGGKTFITRGEFASLLRYSLDCVKHNPVIRYLYLDDEFPQILRRMPKEPMAEHIAGDEMFLASLIENWQMNGSVVKGSIPAITGILRALFVMTFHKNVIGEDNFEETSELLVDLIAQGLIRGRDGND